MRFVGFDPGGDRQFGWCVIEGATLPFSLVHSGCVNDAAAAVEAVVQAVGVRTQIDAVGIDGPLFWTPSGRRRVDSIVREAIKSAGAPNAGGTVQQVNSLRGACITQGVVTAYLLRRVVHGVRITEAHPEALLWLINVASAARRVRDVSMEHLGAFISCHVAGLSEHERDAALGAIAAWAMASGAAGWRDLAVEDSDAIVPFSPIEYWMPIEASPNQGIQPPARKPRLGRGSAPGRTLSQSEAIRLVSGPACTAAEAIVRVPTKSGYYTVFIDDAKHLPIPYCDLLLQRATTLIYVGTTTTSLNKRLVEQDLRHQGASTFFRGIGAILGFRPPPGSLVGKANQDNYEFRDVDTAAIVRWIDAHLSVNWVEVNPALEATESSLIRTYRPILNTKHNPDPVDHLTALRKECRKTARGA